MYRSPGIVAHYIGTSSGAWGPATLGGTPTADDTVVIGDGYTVTVLGDAACASFSVAQTGKLIVDTDGTLTFAADSTVRGLNSGRADRLVVEAGGTLQHDGAGDITLTLGGDWFEMARFVCNGTSESRAAVRRKPGNTTSHLTIASGSYTGAALVSFAYTDFADTSLDVTYRRAFDGAMIACDLEYCTIARPREWFQMQSTGGAATAGYVRHRIVGNVFSDYALAPGAVLFTLMTASYASGARAVTIEDNSFGRGGVTLLNFNAEAGAADSGNWSIKRNVFEGGVAYGDASSSFGDGVIAGNLYYLRKADDNAGNYRLRGYEDDPFCFCEGHDSPAGNPHYYHITGTATIRRPTFDFVGVLGDNDGNPIDVFAGGSCTSTGGLVLRYATGSGAGALWSAADNANPAAPAGVHDLDHWTIYSAGTTGGIGLAHSTYTGPGSRVKVRNTLVWSDAANAAFSVADMMWGGANGMTVDYLAPADFHHNAMYGLGTFSNNRIAGVHNQTLKGFNGSNFSVAPTLLDLDAPPGFADAGRTFLSWCRSVRGHSTGDVVADLESGLADLKADTTLIEPMREWVRDGYAVSNPDLIGAASDGGVIGAMGAATTADPVIETGRTGPHDPTAPGHDDADYHTPDFGGFTFFDLAPTGHPLKELVRRIDSDPVYRHSDAMMECYLPGGPADDGVLLPGWAFFGTTVGDDNRFAGFGLSVVDSGTDTLLPLTVRAEPIEGWYDDPIHSDPIPAGFPADARMQGYEGTTPPSEPVMHGEGANAYPADTHVLVLDRATMTVYESVYTYKHPVDGWVCASCWSYNARTGDWAIGVDESAPQYVPPGQHRFPWTMLNAAALPMLPLMLRYDEVYTAGEVNHAIGMTLPNGKIAGTFAWPAQGMAEQNAYNWTGEWGMTVPYGARFRLKADWYAANVLAAGPDTPSGGWGQGALVILKALKEYGTILTDGGANFDLWAVQDSRWPWFDDLADLQSIPCHRFEVVDFEDDLLDIAVSPPVADAGVERTVTVTCRLWDRHPEAHPGDPSVIDADRPVGSPYRHPFQYAVALRNQATRAYVGEPGEGEVDAGYGLFARLTPDDPVATFKVTPDAGDVQFIPFTQPIGMPWAYGAGVPVLATTDDTNPEPTPGVGGRSRRRRRRFLAALRRVF